ncbi:MAG: hypothetical protein H0U52_06780 [Chloroflexi bacterium]|nr:hypothetical protein [Chloroflexota bacterium]
MPNAHVYDTGLGKAQRTLVREAVITALSPLLLQPDGSGRYVRAITTIPRPLRGEGDDNGITMLAKALSGRSPSIAIALGRKTFESADMESVLSRGEIVVSIYACSSNQRSLTDGRLAIDVPGAGSIHADPGIETMLEHIEEQLLGQVLALDGTCEMRAVEEDEVFTADDATVWEQTYSVKVERQINPNRGSTALITSIKGNNNLDSTVGVAGVDPLVTTVAELVPED